MNRRNPKGPSVVLVDDDARGREGQPPTKGADAQGLTELMGRYAKGDVTAFERRSTSSDNRNSQPSAGPER